MYDTLYGDAESIELGKIATQVMEGSSEEVSDEEVERIFGHDKNSKFVSDIVAAYYSDEELTEDTREDIIKMIGFDDESELDSTQYEDFLEAVREFYLENAIKKEDFEDDQEFMHAFIQEQMAFNSVIESVLELINSIDQGNVEEVMESAQKVLADLFKEADIKIDAESVNTIVRLFYDKVYEEFV